MEAGRPQNCENVFLIAQKLDVILGARVSYLTLELAKPPRTGVVLLYSEKGIMDGACRETSPGLA